MSHFIEVFQNAGLSEVLPAVIFIATVVALAAVLLLRRKVATGQAELRGLMESLERGQERIERSVREEVARFREETAAGAARSREESAAALKNYEDSQHKRLVGIAHLQKGQLDSFAANLLALTRTNERKLEELRTTVEAKLKHIQDDNAARLEQMRATVDEKLQGTLEKRLGESFRQVSERLEQVHKGLGEMQALASGVGDLKRVLANVKIRGTWGEIQLESLLEQILSPDQYDRNVKTNPASGEVVEFAIRLPGRDGDVREIVWLPIDAKFPMEDYQRLLEAQENGDAQAADAAAKMLSTRIKGCAKQICDKYLCPPGTTDFGIMFLPIEGLYAEVVRKSELLESLQREYRVVVAGPTTLAALLNSLQMGFRTLAIQKRSGEVWKLLGAVKTEFGKFGTVLDNVKKKLDQASNTMEEASRRSRAIERKLRTVQELPAEESPGLLEEENGDEGQEAE